MKKEKKVVLYARIKEVNKNFLMKQANINGFLVVSEYLDEILTAMRKRREKK